MGEWIIGTLSLYVLLDLPCHCPVAFIFHVIFRAGRVACRA